MMDIRFQAEEMTAFKPLRVAYSLNPVTTYVEYQDSSGTTHYHQAELLEEALLAVSVEAPLSSTACR